MIDGIIQFLIEHGEKLSSTLVYLGVAAYLFHLQRLDRVELLKVIDRYHKLAEDQIVTLNQILERLNEKDRD